MSGTTIDTSADAQTKPLMRGRLHQVAFFLSIPAGVALVLVAGSTTARIAVAIYSLSLCGLFGASAAYHTCSWSDKSRLRMKRLDHSMIFILIAGTYTPFALLVVKGTWGHVLLAIVWTGALAGVVLKVTRIDGFQTIGGALYIVLGWMAVLALPKMLHNLTIAQLALVFTGAVTYTLGAVVLRTNKPNPSPRFFGYHEVWHTATIVAAACFYVVMMELLLGT